VAKIIAKK